MREKPTTECPARVEYVRGVGETEMCSRDSSPTTTTTTLHPALTKVNGNKNSSPQPIPHGQQNDNKLDGGCLPTPGGRLKFFKDGKFILELSHRRDGERTTWFPVPKKTFWPPASTTPNRQESSTSLSVSDDNSSIQSSPWQRDHCWKQTHPQRCTTKKYNFYYHRNPHRPLIIQKRQLSIKKRRPLDTTPILINDKPRLYKKLKNNIKSGKSLILIIDKLSRIDQNIVSPRKRILRELERVSLEDQASKRRATPQPITPTTTTTTIPVTKQLSSYSITSILGEDKPSQEPGFLRNLLKLDDNNTVKYTTSHTYTNRGRLEQFLPSPNTSIHNPIYGLPMLPPVPYRAPGLWMHYPSTIHYQQQLPIYPPTQHTSSSSSPVHHYKDYREQALTPPSDMPLNLSKHAG